jgi:hypothetical protein
MIGRDILDCDPLTEDDKSSEEMFEGICTGDYFWLRAR